MIACGGGTNSSPTTAPNATVSVSSDPQLVALWTQAQQYLATNDIVLNAAAMAVFPNTPPDTRPADQRALSASNAGVTVTILPDLTAAQLEAENPGTPLQHNTDPTGIVHCPLNSEGVKYCVSYVSGTSIYVAASQKYSDGATGYEMQNVILAKLGYDTSKR